LAYSEGHRALFLHLYADALSSSNSFMSHWGRPRFGGKPPVAVLNRTLNQTHSFARFLNCCLSYNLCWSAVFRQNLVTVCCVDGLRPGTSLSDDVAANRRRFTAAIAASAAKITSLMVRSISIEKSNQWSRRCIV